MHETIVTCPNTPVLVVAPKGDVFCCPKAGVDCCPKGEGDVVPKGLELGAPNPANGGDGFISV
jgi:hypothetical protein